ncbi:MAG TPA: hypothetical protein VI541_05585 [Actinomycetota bacterium]|nr:hypothetical protein [Actinomycetota bacterium]
MIGRSIISLALATSVFLTSEPVEAIDRSPSPYASERADRKSDLSPSADAKIEDLRRICLRAIERRLPVLERLALRIETNRRLDDARRDVLSQQVRDVSSGIMALRGRLASGSSLESLLAECRSVRSRFRVFVVVEPKVHLVIAGDRSLATAEKLENIHGRLTARVDQAQTEGRDMLEARVILDRMKSALDKAKSEAASAIAIAIALDPADHPNNRDQLRAARTLLRSAFADLKQALGEARAVMQLLH